MPLHNPNPTVVPAPVPAAVPPVIETTSVYVNTNERVKTIPHIEGNTWTVEYYGRVIGDMDPATLDTDITEETLIQFQLVKNMELRVTQNLQQYTDPETQTSTLQGQANMYPIVVPIIGDVFLAQLGDGTWGKFAITTTERQSMFKYTAWAITYTLAEYVDEDTLTDVNGKVVQTLVFDLKGLNEPGGALATLSEYERNVLRKKYLVEMTDRFYEEFYKRDLRTFCFYDEDDGHIYDPYLVEFWNYFVGKEINPKWDIPHQYDVRGSLIKQSYITIWDVIREQRRVSMPRVVYAMRRLGVSVFQLPYIQFTLFSGGVNVVIHPHVTAGVASIAREDEDNTPYDPYIFSEAFYDNANAGQSAFELQVQKMIDGQPIAYSDIEPFFLNLGTLSTVERFYRIPILAALFTVCR